MCPDKNNTISDHCVHEAPGQITCTSPKPRSSTLTEQEFTNEIQSSVMPSKPVLDSVQQQIEDLQKQLLHQPGHAPKEARAPKRILTDQEKMKQIMTYQIPNLVPNNITEDSRETFAEFPDHGYKVY